MQKQTYSPFKRESSTDTLKSPIEKIIHAHAPQARLCVFQSLVAGTFIGAIPSRKHPPQTSKDVQIRPPNAEADLFVHEYNFPGFLHSVVSFDALYDAFLVFDGFSWWNETAWAFTMPVSQHFAKLRQGSGKHAAEHCPSDADHRANLCHSNSETLGQASPKAPENITQNFITVGDLFAKLRFGNNQDSVSVLV